VNLACEGLLLGMQAEGLAPKAPLSTIARIKHQRILGDVGWRPRGQDTFGTITRDDLHTYRLMNPPLYPLISGRKAETGPTAKASDTLTDGGLPTSKPRKSAVASTRPKAQAMHQT
jgi:hypothetical protein